MNKKTKAILIVVSILIILLFSSLVPGVYASLIEDNIIETKETTSEAYIPSETNEVIIIKEIELKAGDLVISDTENPEQLQSLIQDCQQRQKAAHQMAEAARLLGYSEQGQIISLAKQEW